MRINNHDNHSEYLESGSKVSISTGALKSLRPQQYQTGSGYALHPFVQTALYSSFGSQTSTTASWLSSKLAERFFFDSSGAKTNHLSGSQRALPSGPPCKSPVILNVTLVQEDAPKLVDPGSTPRRIYGE